ncbi:hypothetical protein BGX27_005944 [Mortierella sp. AM989]|nr:hypothetical protein BGX27_005944 [Mortierella sp. AM989]
MGRQRSQSTSSMGTMTKSPSSLMASLSTSVALYDNQQPPKTLQDILLLAQSHYISHRYVPALTLYKLAAERHHSLPACCSLYALYTSTLNVPGLVRSDTKATQILIHALHIWIARRWSSSRLVDNGSKRSETRDELDELEEYFAHPKRPTRSQRRIHSDGARLTIPTRKQTERTNRTKGVAASIESEYRTPLHFANQNTSQMEVSGEVSETEPESESENDEDDDSDPCESYDDCDECDDDDDVEEKEEEARRIGLATDEIEDIIQKLCSMIQKGVLGLDESVLVKAVSTLRVIDRGLCKEAEAWKQEQARSKSMFSSESANSAGPGLLLTQGIDLSFLNFSPEEDNVFSIIQSRSISPRPQEQRHRTSALPPPITKPAASPEPKSNPTNPAITNLPSGEREQDRALSRAIRIRIMFTLGWVHQQKGEYNYGAQAYGVCSEIAMTGKRQLSILQQQAMVHRQTCLKLQKEAQELIVTTKPIQIREQKRSVNKGTGSSGTTMPDVPVLTSFETSNSASTPISVSTSASTPTVSNHSGISSPSSIASSDSGSMSIRGSGPISSLSAAMWSSSLFRLTHSSETASLKSKPKSKSVPTLHRSKSLLLESKVKAIETIVSPKEIKEPQQHQKHHHHHHHPRAQHRTKTQQSPTPVLTMSGHQKKAVKCGHCGQSRILMPLCVCKKVRYCNGECRLANLETHRLTGCHAGRIGIGAAGLVDSDAHSSVNSGIAL